ncbi:MAG: hypothetical protein NT018_13290 [Armatimonadetes bacterium]|nr:hypothetical protein [Armatimonadota bacterium]
MLRFYLLGALVVIMVGAAAVGALALGVGENAPAFKIEDQFGKTWDSAALKGNVVVVIVANRDSGRAMDPWVSNLKSNYGSKIQLLGLLDLHTIPGIVRGIARARIRKETSDPLMLDFGGKIAGSYLVSDNYPVVVVIDKSLVVKGLQKTQYNQSAYGNITDAIDAALKK